MFFAVLFFPAPYSPISIPGFPPVRQHFPFTGQLALAHARATYHLIFGRVVSVEALHAGVRSLEPAPDGRVEGIALAAPMR